MDQCNYGYYRMYKYVYMYDIVIFVICFIYTVFKKKKKFNTSKHYVRNLDFFDPPLW